MPQKCFGAPLACAVSIVLCLLAVQARAGQFASDTWAQVSRYIAVQPGTTEAVWEDAAKSQITNGALQMTAVGDGTYRALIQLTPGATYNFLYFAKTGASPPAGLQPNSTYYDAVPSGGNIQSGTQPLKVTRYDTSAVTPARYGAIGTNFDARRVITVPGNLVPGDTFYVYGNFADRPISIKNFDANAVDTNTVRLSWEAPYGNWGQGGESMKAADVIAGGNFIIYRNTSGSTTTYTKVTQIAGSDTSYTDTGLSAGTTYYYVMTAKDAYQGDTSDSPFVQLVSDTTPQDTAIPNNPVRVRFKVHHLDMEYVERHGRVVYLTRENERNIYFAPRVLGIIRKVNL